MCYVLCVICYMLYIIRHMLHFIHIISYYYRFHKELSHNTGVFQARHSALFIPSLSRNILRLFSCCRIGAHQKIMDVSREAPD